jgi:SAM-dependent methyltransferase
LSIESWNRRYAAGEKLDLAPLPLVERFAANLPAGDALDLACGPGRHAIYLAERGWRVTAVDGSPIAIDALRARSEKGSIDARLADLERGGFAIPENTFDLVLDILYLQRDLIPGLKAAVRPGGHAIVMVLLADPADVEESATRTAKGELAASSRTGRSCIARKRPAWRDWWRESPEVIARVSGECAPFWVN